MLDARVLSSSPVPAFEHGRVPFWRLGVLLVGVHLLQMAWGESLYRGGIAPDFALVVAVAIALMGGPIRGAFAGLGAGYLGYLASMWHPGSFLFSHGAAGALVGWLAPRLGVSHPIAPPLAAIAATLCADALFLLLSPTDLSLAFWARHALVASLWHAFLIWPVLWLARRVVKTRR